MKTIYKYFLLTILATSTVFVSCETTELELLTSPNALSPDQADPDFLLNSIQMDYVDAITDFNNLSAQLTRIDYFNGLNYFNDLGSGTLTSPWNRLYADIIPDLAAIEGQQATSTSDLSFHIAVSKTLEAHLLMHTVDFLGDIVYSQANQPTVFPNPELDDDAAVYAAAINLLNEASALFGTATTTVSDLFYQGDTSKWIKLVNTLKMRAALTTGDYPAVIAATNIISSTADDFEFSYGTNVLQPDNRHPEYAANYTASGVAGYRSNWLMHNMAGTYGDFFADDDVRRRYYFLRQNYVTPGNITVIQNGGFFIYSGNGPDAATLSCSIETVPSHLEFTPDEDYWCSVKMGYWGRSHGNNRGTPPDDFFKTASGVYPSGGSFDSNPDWLMAGGSLAYLNVGLGNGGGGAGIEPIYLASYTDFMKAEAHLAMGNTGMAATFMQSAITKSVAKVQGFAALDAGADLTLAPSAARNSAFISNVISDFNAAPLTSTLDGFGWPTAKAKMDILGEQYFIAMYGGAGDAYNFTRRTGYPRTLARNLDPAPGLFPRTLLYPGSEVSSNANISQRPNLNTQVFWDNGVINPSN